MRYKVCVSDGDGLIVVRDYATLKAARLWLSFEGFDFFQAITRCVQWWHIEDADDSTIARDAFIIEYKESMV